MKKRIAIIIHEYYPVLSGGTIYAEKMASELSRLGYEIQILTCGVGKDFPREEVNEFFKIRRFFTGRNSKHDAMFIEHLLFFILGFPQIFIHLFRHKFTLLFPIFALPSGIIGLIPSKIFRIPTIVFVDAADTPGFESAMKSIITKLAFLFRIVTKYSDGVVIVDGLQDIALPQINNKNVAIIPHGTSIPDSQARPGNNGDIIQFLSIGRIVPRKGFDHIIKAMYLVSKVRRDFHLYIVGYGTAEKQIYNLIKDCNLTNYITLTGRVEYEDIDQYYLNSDCYIFYGYREGSSLALLEALAYGLPVIASDYPENNTFVNNNVNGFLAEHPNPNKLSLAILDILENKEKLPSWGTNSKKTAKQYTWDNIAKMHDEFFKKVLHN